MTNKKRDFEELDTPAAAAKKLGVSVATLRKYSLIVEKVTGNENYFERTKQKSRLYHQKDIEDLDAFYKLAKTKGLTLKDAARQIYAVSDNKESKKAKKADIHTQEETPDKNQLMDPRQVAKLLGALQNTIATQNSAIDSLKKQLDRIEKQNKELLEKQDVLEAPKSDTSKKDLEIDPKIAAMPDISGIVTDDEEIETATPKTAQEKRQEVKKDRSKSEKEVHNEILSKAKENAQKRQAQANAHRTLADMQVPKEKKHWWQRFLNY